MPKTASSKFVPPVQNHVEGLAAWSNLKQFSGHKAFDLIQFAVMDKDSHRSSANPGGLTQQHIGLIEQAMGRALTAPVYSPLSTVSSDKVQKERKRLIKAGEGSKVWTTKEWEQNLVWTGFYKSLLPYLKAKYDAGTLPRAWINPLFPDQPQDLHEAAKALIAQYEEHVGPITVPEHLRLEVSILPSVKPLLEHDIEFKKAWQKLLRHTLRHPEIMQPINESVAKALSRMAQGASYAEVHALMSETYALANELAKGQPWMQEFNDSMTLVLKRLAAHPDHLTYPNESTRATREEITAFLNTRFPIDGDVEKLETACPGWKQLSEGKQAELLEKNRALHAAFQKYTENTLQHNALYDKIHRDLNEGFAPREFAILSAGLALRVLPTLPELYLREVTSRARSEHGDAVAQNSVDERGSIPTPEDPKPKKRAHADLYFDFARSMEKFAPGEPLVTNMRRYDMLLRLLEYKRDGLSFDTLEAFEEKVMNDGTPLAYMKHAAAHGKIDWDGFDGVDPSPEAQRHDFAEMQRLLPEIPVELADYAQKSIDFHLREAKEFKLYKNSVTEILGTLTRECSTDRGGSYMEAMLLLAQHYLGYQGDKKAKTLAFLWPYVHVGEAAGVEVDHADLARKGLMDQLSIAKMDQSGRFAQWLTESFKQVSGPEGFQGLHYKHYDLLTEQMDKARAKVDKDKLVLPKPETPIYDKGKGSKERMADALVAINGTSEICLIEATTPHATPPTDAALRAASRNVLAQSPRTTVLTPALDRNFLSSENPFLRGGRQNT